MGQTTIEWTWRRLPSGLLIPGYTFNIVWGCSRVSEGCKLCYADTLSKSYGYTLWGPKAERRTFGEAYWLRPLLWNREAEQQGHQRNVFCSSMADLFENHPTVNQERQKLWPLIECTPALNWLLLTKRPQNILDMVPWNDVFPENVWVGASVENQRRTNERVPTLLQVPARVRFLSCEPLLEAVDLSPWLAFLQWVIVGGESGKAARPMRMDWATGIRDQCRAANVPFHFKQWGGRTHKSGGRILDGRTWDDMPEEHGRRTQAQQPILKEERSSRNADISTAQSSHHHPGTRARNTSPPDPLRQEH